MAANPDAIRQRIEHADNLPTLSVVSNQITRLVNAPSTSAADIGRLIESDQSLTANVLKLVNSAYYSFPQRIRSIQHAVVILGFSKVKNVVLTASVIESTKDTSTGHLDLRRLWQHAMGTAIAAKVIADLTGSSAQAEDAFISGLLHDIGKFILAVVAPDEYAPVLAAAHNRLLLDAENEALGFNHTHAGKWLATRWRLPGHIQDAIQHHHHPSSSREHHSLIMAVHLADILVRALGVGFAGDARIPPIAQDVVNQYRLSARALDTALGRIMADLDRATDFFNLLNS